MKRRSEWTQEDIDRILADRSKTIETDFTVASSNVSNIPLKLKNQDSKLENDFYVSYIVPRLHSGEIVKCLSPGMQFYLAKSTTYKPDFVCLMSDGSLRIFETKGFFREDAIVKLKVSAEIFSFFQFFLVTKKGKTFILKEIPHG